MVDVEVVVVEVEMKVEAVKVGEEVDVARGEEVVVAVLESFITSIFHSPLEVPCM